MLLNFAMKKKSIFYLFITGIGLILSIMLFSCANEKKRNISESDKLKIKLIGKWGGLGEQAPVFYFTSDSIYYYDRLKFYSYEILNGEVIINFPTTKGILKRVTVIKDTMFFFDEFPDTIKAFRYH